MFVCFICDLLVVVNEGFMFFFILCLSDGGYIENFVIFFFLKKCLFKIVVVDGGYKINDIEWGESLLDVLELVCKKLYCF